MDGLEIGVVKENYHADYPGMVQITFPSMDAEGNTTAWMPVASVYAGKDYGAYCLPEKGDQVIVGFIGDDIHNGVVLGSLWNTKNTIPKDTTDKDNFVRTFVTKGGHSISIKDGDEGHVTVKSKAGHKIEIIEKDKKLNFSSSDGKNKITIDEGSGAIAMQAESKVHVKAENITIEGKLVLKGNSISIEADNDLTLKGNQVKIDGTTLKANGKTAELTGSNVKVESQGILTLKGSMTKIN